MTHSLRLETAMARRELLWLGACAGLGAALMPRLALASAEPELMPRVREVFERWVGPGKFPGMIATLGLPGREPHFLTRGSEGFTDPDAMSPDSLFRIYSMTKPITGMAAMILVEDGKLGLDQPVSDILPKFAKLQVQITPDGSLTDLKPAKTPITIRNLITHTSGLGYSIIQQGPLRKAYNEAGLAAGRISRLPIPGFERAQPVNSLTLFADRLAEMPLVYEPATKWSYSVGLDLIGRVIELVSGMSFDMFLKRRIFEPAGMTSTWFQVPPSEAKRLTTNYGVVGTVFAPIDEGRNSIYLEYPPCCFGGSGLVSSPRDYDRFLNMLAQHGMIGKERVIGELAVRVGTGNLLPEGVDGPAMMAPRSQFGAGGRVGVGPEAGIYGWAGAAGTVGTVDMRGGIRSGIFVQFMPPTSNSLLPEYQKALQQDVMSLIGGRA